MTVEKGKKVDAKKKNRERIKKKATRRTENRTNEKTKQNNERIQETEETYGRSRKIEQDEAGKSRRM
jgi:hypothetical protein